MEYITDTTDEVAKKSTSERIKFLHKSIESIRHSEQMGVKYMQKWEERVYDRMEGWQQGKAEGHSYGTAVTLVKNVQNLMKNLNMVLEDACAAVGISVEQYNESYEYMKKQGLF